MAGAAGIVRRHLSMGWWSLLVFLTMGLLLEGLHGFKIAWYLDVDNATRRLMWTLGHAHGTLFSLINLAFAATVRAAPWWRGRSRALASWWLVAATVVMPLGFFLAGLFVYGGDPGVPIVLVAVGGLVLLVAVLLTASGVSGSATGVDASTEADDEGVDGMDARRKAPATKATKRSTRRRRSRR